MNIEMLVTDSLRPIPQSIKVIRDYGQLDVKFVTGDVTRGTHCIIEGSEADIVQWLKPFQYVIIGCGMPAQQAFDKMCIKDHLGVIQ